MILCNTVDREMEAEDSLLLGMSMFPISQGSDGVPLRPSSNEWAQFVNWVTLPGQDASEEYGTFTGDTMTHEFGHFFGLYHPFFEGEGQVCEADNDRIADTPMSAKAAETCDGDLQATCGSTDPVWNFMDYGPDGCMYSFTAGQAVRMHATLEMFKPVMYKQGVTLAGGRASEAKPTSFPIQTCITQFQEPAAKARGRKQKRQARERQPAESRYGDPEFELQNWLQQLDSAGLDFGLNFTSDDDGGVDLDDYFDDYLFDLDDDSFLSDDDWAYHDDDAPFAYTDE